jgi:flagellar biosynthesis/type III secretory pathway M-ring protein FliF/YscJ
MDMTTEYVLSRKWEESKQTIPTPLRVTVAVLVDGIYKPYSTGKGEPVYTPRTDDEIKNLSDLVKATIGFSDKRKDLVTVQCAQFQSNATEMEKETFFNSYPVRQFLPLIVQWGVVGFIGLLLILMVLRPAIRQITVTPAGYAALPGGGSGGQFNSKEVLATLRANMPGGALPGGVGGGAFEGSSGKADQTALDFAKFQDMAADDLGDDEIPPELRGNQEAVRAFKLQRMAARQAKLTQAQAASIQKEVVDTAKNNPQKTVSLLRQWMDEA